MNRDANAALSMLYVFTKEALHGRRPPQFSAVYLIGLMHAADEGFKGGPRGIPH
jgi:hypothetical protein